MPDVCVLPASQAPLRRRTPGGQVTHLLAGAAAVGLSIPAQAATGSSMVPLAQLSAGDTAWMLSATVLVLLMTLPGLALFYAGMVRKKNVLSTLAQTLATCALVALLWWAMGYSLAFTPGSPYIGGSDNFLLDAVRLHLQDATVSVHQLAPSVPEPVFVMFQMTFAIITPALIVGSFAERMKFSALLVFMALWSLLVYAPLAHAVWEPGGFLAQHGVLDFAGGTVVHINAGVAGLLTAWKLGPRIGYGSEPMMPSNLVYTMIGASLLWVGWMGFNGGSALAADGRAAMAILCTQLAAAAGALSWMLAEWIMRGTPSLLGLCSGAVAGLVAVTPAAGFVEANAAVILGVVSGVACYWGATTLKRVLRTDDSLDVFGVHGIAGILGALLTGALASPELGGGGASVAKQAIGVVVTLMYTGAVSALILTLLDAVIGLRVSRTHELHGLDLSQHGEKLH